MAYVAIQLHANLTSNTGKGVVNVGLFCQLHLRVGLYRAFYPIADIVALSGETWWRFRGNDRLIVPRVFLERNVRRTLKRDLAIGKGK